MRTEDVFWLRYNLALKTSYQRRKSRIYISDAPKRFMWSFFVSRHVIAIMIFPPWVFRSWSKHLLCVLHRWYHFTPTRLCYAQLCDFSTLFWTTCKTKKQVSLSHDCVLIFQSQTCVQWKKGTFKNTLICFLLTICSMLWWWWWILSV